MEYIKFENFIKSVQYGYTADATYSKGSNQYLRITDIVPYFVDKARVPYVLVDEKISDKYLVKKDDLLIARTGATTGYNLLVPEGFENFIFASYLVRYFYDKEKLYPLYLKHVLKSQQWYGFIKNFIGGSAQPGMNPRTMGKFAFPYHDFLVQQKIASILNQYDLLIENNNKRVTLLELQIEKIYKYMMSNINAEEINEIKLREIITIVRGLSYSSDEIDVEEGLNLVNLKNIASFGGFRRDGTKLYNGKYKETQIVFPGDLIMGVTDMTQDRRTVGSVALMPKINGISVISADLIKLNSNISKRFLYSLFRYGNVSKYISQFANGSNVLHLKPESILKIKVNIPNDKVIKKFNDLTDSMFSEIENLHIRNDNLMRQRDLLLPRLMSGKLEVK